MHSCVSRTLELMKGGEGCEDMCMSRQHYAAWYLPSRATDLGILRVHELLHKNIPGVLVLSHLVTQ